MRPLLLAAALFAAACSPFPTHPVGAPPEEVAADMAHARAQVASARALARVNVDDGGELGLAPTFTVTLEYTAPDGYQVRGYDDWGTPLFTYAAQGKSYLFDVPGKKPLQGAIDHHPDLTVRIMHALVHLVDGVAGVDLKGQVPARHRDGTWRFDDDGMQVRFSAVGTRVAKVITAPRLGAALTIDFSDFRTLGGQPAPHHMTATLARPRVILEIDVDEWVIRAPEIPLTRLGNGH